MSRPVEGVDARTDRVAQGVVGVAVLAAFVFRVPWLVPALALVLGIGAVAGPRANGLHWVFERWIAPRLPGSGAVRTDDLVDAPIVQVQDALGAAILVVASLAFVLGIGLIGWLFAIAEAVIAIVAATTEIHIAERLRRRL